METIEVTCSGGTVVNPFIRPQLPVGNVETSQRIVDVLFQSIGQALPDRLPAASQATMNNLTMGGIDPRTGDASFLLRNGGGRDGCARQSRRHERGPHSHDNMPKHSRRSA